MKCPKCGFELKQKLKKGMWIKFKSPSGWYTLKPIDIGKVLSLNPAQICDERTIWISTINAGQGHLPIDNIISVVGCGVKK